MSTSRDWRPGFEQQTARINVTDREWRAFRARCLNDGEHVSEALGRLVRAAPNDTPVVVTRERVNTPSKAEKRPAVVKTTKAEPAGGPVVLSLFDVGS